MRSRKRIRKRIGFKTQYTEKKPNTWAEKSRVLQWKHGSFVKSHFIH